MVVTDELKEFIVVNNLKKGEISKTISSTDCDENFPVVEEVLLFKGNKAELVVPKGVTVNEDGVVYNIGPERRMVTLVNEDDY